MVDQQQSQHAPILRRRHQRASLAAPVGGVAQRMRCAYGAAMSPADRVAAILASIRGIPAAALSGALAHAAHPAQAHLNALAQDADSADEALARAAIASLFGGLVEPLNDSFGADERVAYAELFGRVVWRVCARRGDLAAALAEEGIADEAALLARHRRVRSAAATAATAAALAVPEPRRVAVLSRVTIGADILLTSVAVARIHQRWPAAAIEVIGDAKLGGLLGALPRVRVVPLSYPRRGPLGERLRAWLGARALARGADLAVAPDSRLDQLGILPMGPEQRYLLWENLLPRDRPVSLAEALDGALCRRLGLPAHPPMLPRLGLDADASRTRERLARALGPGPWAAVKLDHGGNPAKALPRAAEVACLRALRARGWRIILDRGFGTAETQASDALLAEAGMRAIDLDDSGSGLGTPPEALAADSLALADLVRFHGSIAGWAAAVACSGLALSYDSVGHHLAAALGVPVVVAFTGYAHDAFPIAWQPRGRGPVTVVTIPPAERALPAQWQRVIDRVPAAMAPHATSAADTIDAKPRAQP